MFYLRHSYMKQNLHLLPYNYFFKNLGHALYYAFLLYQHFVYAFFKKIWLSYIYS